MKKVPEVIERYVAYNILIEKGLYRKGEEHNKNQYYFVKGGFGGKYKCGTFDFEKSTTQ